MKSNTLHLAGLTGKTFLLTMLFTLLFLGMLEVVVRLESFQARLSSPQLGSGHYQLGQKLAFLDRAVKQAGPIDCIMIGSSMVDVGFDPASFQSSYREVRHQDIQCFNFGIDASSAASTYAIARIMVEDYHPRLLIVGTDARDYVLPREDPDVAVVLDTPWVQYRSGRFTLDGWLTDISYFYRYHKHLNRLVKYQFKDTLLSDTRFAHEILPNGFTPLDKVSTYINDRPSPQDQSYEVQYYGRILGSYEMLDFNLESLEKTLAMDGSGTQVIVVEMPVSDGYYYFFGNGAKDYQQFIRRLGELTDIHQIPFWQTEPLDLIPDNGWSDYSHMNTTGAELFSVWLGRQVAQAEISSILRSFKD